MSEIQPDEFDRLAETPGPVGVHRAKRGKLVRILAPFLIFALAGGLAYGVVIFLWQNSGGVGLPPAGDQATPTITETKIIGPSPTVTPTPSPTVSAEPTEEAPPVDLATPVAVLNGAGISGLAGRQQQELVDNGFSAVTTGNLTGTKPAQNTIRYADASQATTATRVGEVLGVSTVEQGETSAGGIDVLLVTNPDA